MIRNHEGQSSRRQGQTKEAEKGGNCGNRRRAHRKSKPTRRRLPDNTRCRRRGRTGRTTSRTKYGRHRRKRRDNAGRQSTDRRPQQISHRRQGSSLHPKKPHSGNTHRKQKDDGGEHKEGGILLQARLENTDFQNSY